MLEAICKIQPSALKTTKIPYIIDGGYSAIEGNVVLLIL